MEYIVTLHLKSGLEIDWDISIEGTTVKDARNYVRNVINGQSIWIPLADDAEVRCEEVDYFKVKEA
ncbi:hypothetical protein FT641_27045 [Bacillus paranthracis]|uniref:hypothetical protein n=1 Tax=Bacillus paranthracis TaxID=2026186 RepID=UPI000BFC10E7|nr:hypothetical protein [Bacillus paranthracis]MBE7117310.1 hypothetical protein [Bacillus paranthracis]MBE7134924.1 hypothetical protein [Bacillus paranthracis]MBE7156333.1 hypothetical protein [Bacillus paranthracis]PGZ29544.1 hypothetical protein COE50_22280 [Bacillus anthracis]